MSSSSVSSNFPNSVADYQLLMCCIDSTSTVADLDAALNAGANVKVILDETQVERNLTTHLTDPALRNRFVIILTRFRDHFNVNLQYRTRPISNAFQLACQFNRGSILQRFTERLPRNLVQELMQSESVYTSGQTQVRRGPFYLLLKDGVRKWRNATSTSTPNTAEEGREYDIALRALVHHGALTLTPTLNTPQNATLIYRVIQSNEYRALDFVLEYLTHNYGFNHWVGISNATSLGRPMSDLISEYSNETHPCDMPALLNRSHNTDGLPHLSSLAEAMYAYPSPGWDQTKSELVMETLLRYGADPQSSISYADGPQTDPGTTFSMRYTTVAAEASRIYPRVAELMRRYSQPNSGTNDSWRSWSYQSPASPAAAALSVPATSTTTSSAPAAAAAS